MATGYIVTGSGDLDDLFKPRTGTAIANTGFLSNGGVDLAQRFEGRGAVPPIPNTNFVSGSSDLAQLFRDANFGTTQINTTLNAGISGANTGYRNDPSFSPAFGTVGSNAFTNGQRFDGLWYTGSQTYFTLSLPSSAIPPDADTVFSRMQVTGNWQSTPGSEARFYSRANFTSDSTFTDSGRGYRRWRLISGTQMDFDLGFVFSVVVWCKP